MVDPTQALPPEDEREGLLDALAELVEQVGIEPLVCAPLVLPQERFFPDVWTPDAAGVERLARRLLRYAGLDEIDVCVELFSDRDAGPPPTDPWTHSEHHSGAAAWFAGIRGGVAYFGASIDQLDDPLGLTAALAHETSHAFRFHHRLMVEDLTTEEQLTDLTTVYLGFGLLTTNVAVRHRSEVIAGTLGGSRWQRTMLGYLSPQALSFLLACHQHLRDAAKKDVTSQLESNQAHYYRKARNWLKATMPQLAERLGMPPRDRWPDPWALDELTEPFEPEASASSSVPAVAPEVEPTRSEPVLRIPDGNPRRAQALVALLGGAIALQLVIEMDLLAAAGVVFAILGCLRLIGRARYWRCSGCDTKVRREVTRCPWCNGMFVMDLEDPADRLEIDPWQVLAERRGGATTGDDES